MIDEICPRPALGAWRRCRPFGRGRGFSLVEILVVLVILSIMTTIALFSYANYRDSQSLQTSADLVRRMLMQARNRAINLNLPQQVVIDIDKDTIWIDQFNSSLTQLKPKVVAEHEVDDFADIVEVQIGSNVYTDGRREIFFESDGRNPHVVVLIRQDGTDPNVDENYYSVRLFPTSGEAQILPKRRL